MTDDRTTLKAQARALFEEGKTYNQIVKILGVQKSSLSFWCGDLAQQRRDHQAMLKKTAPVTIRAKQVNGSQVLTPQQVATMRKEVKEVGYKNLKLYATRYGVSITVISCALRGLTFRDVDVMEAPIPPDFPNYKRPRKRPLPMTDDLVSQLIMLRKQDPTLWTYGALATKAQESTGRGYRATHIAGILIRHDPTLKDLESVKPIPKPRPIAKPKIYIPRTAEQKALRKQQLRQANEALRKFTEEADRYERDMMALRKSK